MLSRWAGYAGTTNVRDACRASLKTVAEIKDPGVLQRIHQNYRITFLRDVALLRYLDDAVLGALGQLSNYNHTFVVNSLAEDEGFLNGLFEKLRRYATRFPPDRELAELSQLEAAKARKLHLRERRDVLAFLREVCTVARPLHVSVREAFYVAITSRGLFPLLEVVLNNAPTPFSDVEQARFCVTPRPLQGERTPPH
jgi:protein phosphatase-4 regulatory subunit 3